jgi:ribose 5-phosphate isomerase B
VSEGNKHIVMGADHLGMELKNTLRAHLVSKGCAVTDLGVHESETADYPDVGKKVAEAIARGEFDLGVLVCGTGAGMAIVANKVPGVRAVCVADPYTAERARASNNAQVITLGSQVVGPEVAKRLIDVWLASEFQGGRSLPKVLKIDQMDAEYRLKTGC